jgi:Kdo2-lipid IVA lauroyltransferase/acyltransferase
VVFTSLQFSVCHTNYFIAMSRILYYLILKPLSFLPLAVLYLLSDLIFFFVYHVTGYRKSVVNNNLKKSFPQKKDDEIEMIQKAFFVHLCDMIVESIRLFSISKNELNRRFKIENTESLEKYYNEGRSVILVGGHYNNWEIAAMGFDLCSSFQAIGIYSPLSDLFFDKKFGKSRSKFGVEIIAKRNVPKSFVMNKDKLTMTIFGADQSPTYSKHVHWMNFLNQETAVAVGTEAFAMKYNYPVLYFNLNKRKRGYYSGEITVLTEHPAKSKKGEITEKHTRFLEQIIRAKPEYWLWSHKRWKRKMTDEERQFRAEEADKAA